MAKKNKEKMQWIWEGTPKFFTVRWAAWHFDCSKNRFNQWDHRKTKKANKQNKILDIFNDPVPNSWLLSRRFFVLFTLPK